MLSSDAGDKKTLSQQRFGQLAQAYVDSATHAKGADLEYMLEIAKPQSTWSVLDVATGGGHTALKFAAYVASVVAADISPRMLGIARDFVDRDNVIYIATDAENLAFAENTFDLVTCRIAPHHFPDCFRFVQECARVIKPGGKLLVQDMTVPENERAARYVDAFERLRDPSHDRAYVDYEWEGMFLDAGLSVEQSMKLSKPAKLLDWAERQNCSSETIEKLQIMLAQAPDDVAEFLRPCHVATDDAGFDHNYVITLGVKI
jgi:ubiquinone/menaquinone biosynthesis C-methylase UbiE